MNTAVSERAAPSRSGTRQAQVHMAGSEALLLDVSTGPFDMGLQRRIWALASALHESVQHVREVVAGVNNLMVVFSSLEVSHDAMSKQVLALWARAQPLAHPGRQFDIAVHYGGVAGEDLAMLAERAGLSEEAFVQRHAEASYEVICLGAMPGYAYLAGLPAELGAPRRHTPRLKLPKGSVIIGGAQASVLPADGPCGWHVIGSASLDLFDPNRTPPCLLAPGDRVRFTVQGFEASAPKQVAA